MPDARVSGNGDRREGLCEECGLEYPVWVAPSKLWNAVIREHPDSNGEPFLCPTCFAKLAERRDVLRPTAWVLLPEDDDLREALLWQERPFTSRPMDHFECSDHGRFFAHMRGQCGCDKAELVTRTVKPGRSK